MWEKQNQQKAEKIYRFSIRKSTVGAVSVVVSALCFFVSDTIYAAEEQIVPVSTEKAARIISDKVTTQELETTKEEEKSVKEESSAPNKWSPDQKEQLDALIADFHEYLPLAKEKEETHSQMMRQAQESLTALEELVKQKATSDEQLQEVLTKVLSIRNRLVNSVTRAQSGTRDFRNGDEMAEGSQLLRVETFDKEASNQYLKEQSNKFSTIVNVNRVQLSKKDEPMTVTSYEEIQDLLRNRVRTVLSGSSTGKELLAHIKDITFDDDALPEGNRTLGKLKQIDFSDTTNLDQTSTLRVVYSDGTLSDPIPFTVQLNIPKKQKKTLLHMDGINSGETIHLFRGEKFEKTVSIYSQHAPIEEEATDGRGFPTEIRGKPATTVHVSIDQKERNQTDNAFHLAEIGLQSTVVDSSTLPTEERDVVEAITYRLYGFTETIPEWHHAQEYKNEERQARIRKSILHLTGENGGKVSLAAASGDSNPSKSGVMYVAATEGKVRKTVPLNYVVHEQKEKFTVVAPNQAVARNEEAIKKALQFKVNHYTKQNTQEGFEKDSTGSDLLAQPEGDVKITIEEVMSGLAAVRVTYSDGSSTNLRVPVTVDSEAPKLYYVEKGKSPKELTENAEDTVLTVYRGTDIPYHYFELKDNIADKVFVTYTPESPTEEMPKGLEMRLDGRNSLNGTVLIKKNTFWGDRISFQISGTVARDAVVNDSKESTLGKHVITLKVSDGQNEAIKRFTMNVLPYSRNPKAEPVYTRQFFGNSVDTIPLRGLTYDVKKQEWVKQNNDLLKANLLNEIKINSLRVNNQLLGDDIEVVFAADDVNYLVNDTVAATKELDWENVIERYISGVRDMSKLPKLKIRLFFKSTPTNRFDNSYSDILEIPYRVVDTIPPKATIQYPANKKLDKKEEKYFVVYRGEKAELHFTVFENYATITEIDGEKLPITEHPTSNFKVIDKTLKKVPLKLKSSDEVIGSVKVRDYNPTGKELELSEDEINRIKKEGKIRIMTVYMRELIVTGKDEKDEGIIPATYVIENKLLNVNRKSDDDRNVSQFERIKVLVKEQKDKFRLKNNATAPLLVTHKITDKESLTEAEADQIIRSVGFELSKEALLNAAILDLCIKTDAAILPHGIVTKEITAITEKEEQKMAEVTVTYSDGSKEAVAIALKEKMTRHFIEGTTNSLFAPEVGNSEHKTGVLTHEGKRYFFDHTEEKDEIRTHYYKEFKDGIPGHANDSLNDESEKENAATNEVEALKTTRHLIDGTDINVSEPEEGYTNYKEGVLTHEGKRYFFDHTEEKDELRTHYYKEFKDGIPGHANDSLNDESEKENAATNEVEALKTTRHLIDGTDINVSEPEEGYTNYKEGVLTHEGKRYFFDHTEEKEEIRTHYYKEYVEMNTPSPLDSQVEPMEQPSQVSKPQETQDFGEDVDDTDEEMQENELVHSLPLADRQPMRQKELPRTGTNHSIVVEGMGFVFLSIAKWFKRKKDELFS